MRKLLFLIVLLVTIFPLFGQGEKDTLQTNKTNFKFGFSFSVLTSRQVNPTFNESEFFIKMHSIRYTIPSSQLSFLCIMDKNKFFIKHELSYSKIHTRIYSDWINNSNQMGPIISTYIKDYIYELLSYNIGFGLKLKKFNLIGGCFIGYLASNNLSIETSNGTNNIPLESKTLLYGVTFEVDYFISKKWYIGIGGSISSKTSNDRYLSYEYNTQSLKLSLGFYIN
ncbi:MAG: hypothetical protein RQ875_04255 [Vicingaceae bacterium]|nr:hypothetical protein [Vicingaceae bacterium]